MKAMIEEIVVGIQNFCNSLSLCQISDIYDNLGLSGVYSKDNTYRDYYISNDFLAEKVAEKIENDKNGFVLKLKQLIPAFSFDLIESEAMQDADYNRIVEIVDSIQRKMDDLRNKSNMELDYFVISKRILQELKLCCQSRALLPTLIFAGSFLESLFVGILNNGSNTAIISAFKAINNHDFGHRTWDLAKFIEVASDKSIAIVSSIDYRYVDAIRMARNLVHPNKQFQEGFVATIDDTRSSLSALSRVVVSLINYNKYR